MKITRPGRLLRFAMPVLALCAALPQTGSAQTPPRPPGAGSTLRETTPPPRPPEAAPTTPEAPAVRPPAPRPPGPSFTLRGVRFVGATVFNDAELQATAADRIGKPATLADIEAIAQQVTDATARPATCLRKRSSLCRT